MGYRGSKATVMEYLKTFRDGSVALSVGKIEEDWSGEVLDPPSAVAAAEVSVRRVPVPAIGDRRRGPLVPAVQSVLSRR